MNKFSAGFRAGYSSGYFAGIQHALWRLQSTADQLSNSGLRDDAVDAPLMAELERRVADEQPGGIGAGA